MKKILLLLLLIFAYYQNYSNANEIENIPIIKKLDKKYLSLIDKDGRITNLKEFNKNGVVVVFENARKQQNGYIFITIIYDSFFHTHYIYCYYGDNYNDFIKNFYEETLSGYNYYFEAKIDIENFKYYDIIDSKQLCDKYCNNDADILNRKMSNDIKDSYDGRMDIKSYEKNTIFFNQPLEGKIKQMLHYNNIVSSIKKK